jgi:EVE domain
VPQGEADTATAWIFKANPDEWSIDEYLDALRSGRESSDLVWLVTRFEERISSGDRVYLWRASGRNAAIVALARATGPVADLPEDKSQYRHGQYAEKYAGLRPRAPLRIEHVLERPLTKVAIQHNRGLADEASDLSIFRWYTQATNFPVQPSEEVALDRECLKR